MTRFEKYLKILEDELKRRKSDINKDAQKPLTLAELTAAVKGLPSLDSMDDEDYRAYTLAQLDDFRYAYCARYGIDDYDLQPYQPYGL